MKTARRRPSRPRRLRAQRDITITTLAQTLAQCRGAQAVFSSDIAAPARPETRQLGVRQRAQGAADTPALQAVLERFAAARD